MVEVTDDIPENVRPGLSVDVTVQVEPLADVTFVSRPAYARAASARPPKPISGMTLSVLGATRTIVMPESGISWRAAASAVPSRLTEPKKTTADRRQTRP